MIIIVIRVIAIGMTAAVGGEVGGMTTMTAIGIITGIITAGDTIILIGTTTGPIIITITIHTMATDTPIITMVMGIHLTATHLTAEGFLADMCGVNAYS
jgi:hypothetical protein